MPPLPPALPRSKGFLQRLDGGIYYEVTGSGPALVFAHGLGGNHLSWWQQVPFFRGTHTCVTFSHRGFFPSDAPANQDLYADDLLALIDHLGLDKISLVAQSMGGWTAVNFAFAFPDRLRAMVLASTSGPIDPAQSGAGAALEAWRAESAASRVVGSAAGVHQAMGLRGAEEQPEMHFLYRAIDELSTTLDKEALRARMTAVRTISPSALATVQTPTLWLTGAEDLVFPSLVAPLMAAGMPHARHVQIPRAGHSVYFERAAEFNRIVAGFLEEVA
jgi:pimeloyl-ACP methyl ester carboxylesterase